MSQPSKGLFWLFLGLALIGIGYRYYREATEIYEPVVEVKPVPSTTASAVPSLPSPFEWPLVRYLEMAQGDWIGDGGSTLSLQQARRKKGVAWLLGVTLTKEGVEQVFRCEVAPGFNDGYHGACNGPDLEKDSPTFVQFRMSKDKQLYVECPMFGATFHNKSP